MQRAPASLAQVAPSGLPSVGEIPWGTHLCQFYRQTDNLVSTLVPYFQAGLLDNERCIWIASEPFGAQKSREALRAVVPNLDDLMRQGQIEILDYTDWYVGTRPSTSKALVHDWLAREEEALERGYSGLRISGNTFWLQHEDWAEFAKYESAVHGALHGRRIIALCSYCLDHCDWDEIMDVLRNHRFALVQRKGSWDVVHSATLMLASVESPQQPTLYHSLPVAPYEPVPQPDAAEKDEDLHAVQFYQDDAFPAARVASYLAGALRYRQGALVIATKQHIEAIQHALGQTGIDPAGSMAAGWLVFLDAHDMLARLRIDHISDEAQLERTFGEHLDRLRARFGAVRVYGEIVDLLCRSGQAMAAISLEELWHRHLERQPLPMLCSYGLPAFDGHAGTETLHRICELHAVLHPVEEPPIAPDGSNPNRSLEELRHLTRRLQIQTTRCRQLERERSRLFEAESKARLRAQAATEHLARLQKVTSALSEAATLSEIARVATTEVARVIGADEALLVVPTEGGTKLRLIGHAGLSDALVAALACFPREAPLPIAMAFRTGLPLWLPTSAAIAEHYPNMGPLPTIPQAIACLPLCICGQRPGALGFGFRAAREFPPPDRALLDDVAKQVALSLERARSYEEARKANERLELLADASARFSDARLDLAQVLDSVTAEVTRTFADSCTIALQAKGPGSKGKAIAPAAVHHDDPRFALRIPLRASGEILGTLCAVRDPAGAAFAASDQELLQDLADRAALAIDNALLYEHAQRERQRAEEANRAKDEFLAMLGHELRNPLSPIVTALQLMRLRGGDVLMKERTIIERQTRHMVRLVDDLLDVSRITRGKVELERVETELADVVTAAIEMASPLLEQRAHRLETFVPQSGLVVEADVHRLAQAVGNLLTNAAKYTPPGGTIEIRAEVRGQDKGQDKSQGRGATVRLGVRDNGIGIDAALLPHVFDMFLQGRRTLARSEGGLGLGLTIVRSIGEMHGGTVSAHSAGPGKGSEFTIELPLGRAHGRAAAQGRPHTSDVRFPDCHDVTAAPRILVVDDNGDAANMLAEVLCAAGYRVQVAHDGPAALAIAEGFRPELALLDIGLPAMDGYELGRRLRALLADSPPKLVAVTGYGLPSDRARSQAAGFDGHLVKPIDLDRLPPTLCLLLGQPDASKTS